MMKTKKNLNSLKDLMNLNNQPSDQAEDRADSDARLVYSSDPTLNKKCSQCKELMIECLCRPEDDPQTFKGKAVVRIEKNGRAGKIVTVIDQLPWNQEFLKNLTTKLKKQCGCGGTFKFNEDKKVGMIEIQGEKRDLVMNLLKKEQVNLKS